MAELNWSQNIEYNASDLVQPASVVELQELVAGAAKVKALGTRHSFNRIADTADGLQVSTAALDLQPSVDHEAMTATVPGGWTYGEVAQALESKGVALHNMGSLPHISVAGGTATGTHGSGDNNRILAAAISGIELVTADGSLRRFDRSNPELMAMAVGLGAFGIITQMTLDVEPTYLMRQDIYRTTSWDEVLANLDEIMGSAYSVNLHCLFGVPEFRTIWQKSRVGTDIDDRPVTASVPDELWGATRWDTVVIEDRVTKVTEPGPWLDRLPHFTREGYPSSGGDELQSEYFVSRRDAKEALQALREMGKRIDPHLRGSEIRSVAADDLWLSPSVGRDTLSIGFTWQKHPAEVMALLPSIEAALAPFAPTPHWGKLFTMRRDELLDRFPRLDDFLALATELDPEGKFQNNFLQRLTG